MRLASAVALLICRSMRARVLGPRNCCGSSRKRTYHSGHPQPSTGLVGTLCTAHIELNYAFRSEARSCPTHHALFVVNFSKHFARIDHPAT
jgi:hypothetical protein